MKLSTKLFRRRSYRWGVVCFLMCFLFFNASVSVVTAGPEGAQVVNGQVTIQQSGSNTAITASDKAIINYSSFDIAQPETVQFIQPGSTASVLNRILSANPTNINGTLLANGRVFFVNPAGVYFGNGATINVNQLVASGLNISNADFINGRYNFAGGNGAVINNGDISAQQVYLIGKQVTNSGNINCPAGYVVMAAGDRVFLGEPGSDIVLDVEGTSLSESANAAAPEVGVLNEGTVEAAGGIIALAAAGDIYSQAISNVGSLSTSADTGDAGQIKLTAAGGEVINTGTIEASGSEGGQVSMEGARVGQFGTIHTDGATGDGGNVDLTASDVVALSSDSITTANAGTNGNGGDVIVYSPETALFRTGAQIEAKGGSESGNGGFVEVSGKKHVEVYGMVDTRAISGEDGTFLIDPTNVTITGTDTNGSWSGTNTGTWTPSASDSVANVNTALENGNVIVTTFNSLSPEEDGDITVESGVTASANANSLTLQAADDIILNANIDMSAGTGNLTLTADWNDGDEVSDDIGAIVDGGGVISMNATGTLLMTAGSGIGTSAEPIETTGLTDVAAATTSGGIFINNSTSGIVNVTTIGGTVGLDAGAGDISLFNTSRDITVSSAIDTDNGMVTLSGALLDVDSTIDATGEIDLDASGNFDLDSTITSSAGNVDISAAGTIDGTGTIAMGTGSLVLNAGSGIGISGNPVETTGLTDVAAATTTGGIFINNSTSGIVNVTTIGGTVGLDAGAGDISLLNTSRDITVSSAIDTDNGTVTLSGSLLDIDATIDATGMIDLDASGNFDLDSTITSSSGNIDIVATGTVSLNDNSISIGSGTLTIDGASINAKNAGVANEIDADGDVSLTGAEIGGGNVIDITGDTSVKSTLTVDSDGIGDVDLDINADLFDVVNITIEDLTATTRQIDIDWDAGDDIDMETGVTALTITDIDTSNSDIDVAINQQAGNVIVESIDTGNADFALTASNGTVTDSGAITANKLAVDTSGGVLGGAITLDYGHSVSTINLTSDNGSNIQYVDADGVGIELANAGAGDVTITAGGDVSDSGAITANKLTVNTSGATSGGEIILDTSASNIDTINMTSGKNSNIQYVDTDGVNVELANAGAGDVTITAGGDVTDSGAMTANMLTVDTSSAALGGVITLDTATNDADTISMISGNNSNIQYVDSDSIDIEIVDAGNGNVTINSGDGINDAAGDTVGDISATTITMTAAGEIGGTRALETAAASIEAHSTAAGDIIINETDNITLTNVDTAAGDISVTAGGAINAGSVIANDGSVSLTGEGLLTATDVQAVDSSTTGDYDIMLETSAGGMDLQSVVADDDITATATAGDMDVVSLTAGDSVNLEATAGAITQSAGIITADGSLSMKSNGDLSMSIYTVANPGSTNLILDSTGGSAIVTGSAADDWQLITATAQHDVVLLGDGDIRTGDLQSKDISGLNGVQIFTDTGSGGSLDAQGTINSGGFVTVDVEGAASFADTVTAGGNIELEAGGDLVVKDNLTATGGGVSLLSETGKIYTPGGANDTLNVDITGYSAAGVGVDLDPDKPGSGEAAIVIRTKEDLILGSNAQLIANGQYDPQQNDDRSGVGFEDSISGGGDPVDVAIYLRSHRVVSGDPSGHVAVGSKVTITQNGTMIVDAGDKVTFGGKFNESVFNQTHRLEVVSRSSQNLNEVIRYNRLPFADNPEAIRNWFKETSTGYFAGAYVLRGVKTLLAEVLALSNPVPLVPPRPLEPEFRGEVEGPDTEALVKLLSDLGIGVQPYMTEAYADSLSTDLRLYKAAEKLQELMPVLEDADGTRIAALKAAVEQFFPTLDVLSDERMDSFAQVLASHKGDETNYDLAGQCIFALIEYVNILGTDIGWPVETSVEFVMGRYVPRLTENDEIRIAVIQMHLQKGL